MISPKKFSSAVVDGILTRFLSDFIIPTEQHVRVYNYVYDPINGSDVSDILDPAGSGLYVRETDNPTSSDLQGLDKWDLVDNSILFYTAPPTTSSVFLEVATNPEEFGGTLVQPSVERAESAADAAEASEIAAAASEAAAAVSETNAAASASAANTDKLAVDARLDTVQSNTLTVEQNLDAVTSDPVATQLANAATNAATATTKAAEAVVSATEAQLEAWIAEAEAMTSESNAKEAVGVFTKTYTSNGDGTFSSVTNAWYSSLHYATQATSGGTERTSARNTAISASASGVLALATTPTQSFATRTYVGNGTSQDIVMGIGDGAELITNGTFDSDVTGINGLTHGDGWSALYGGSLLLDSTGQSNHWAFKQVTVEIGVPYVLSFDLEVGTATTSLISLGDGDGTVYTENYFSQVDSTTTTELQFTPTTTSITLCMYSSISGTQYYDNISVKEITSPIKSYDPNWVSGRAYSLANEQDAYCIHNYYIYKLLADVTSATTPDADPTKWEVVPDGVSVPWFNSQVWIKRRNITGNNVVVDSLRGVNKELYTNDTAAELSIANVLNSFNSDGFTIGSDGLTNAVNDTYVAWQEQFDTMVSGTTNQGKRYITASNAQSGKGMTIYVGSGTAGHEIPHGLGTKIDFNVVKPRTTVTNWSVYDSHSGATQYKYLNSNAANATATDIWNNTEPTDSVFTVGTSGNTNALDVGNVAYFSSNRDNHTVTKMYQGTGAAGKVVFEGIDCTDCKVVFKNLSSVGGWWIADTVRGAGVRLFADLSDAESATTAVTFTDNGIVLNDNNSNLNSAGSLYLAEITFPNYDKPTGGLDIPAGSVISYAEGTDGTTGDLDSIETTTLTSDVTLSEGDNYIYIDKGNIKAVTDVKLLKGTDRVSADKWGVVSPSDATLKTTDKHSDYVSATGVVSASSELATYEAYQAFNVEYTGVTADDAWISSITTGWIQYSFSEPRVLKSYRFRNNIIARLPIDWTIEGSDDGVNWTVIETVSTYVPTETLSGRWEPLRVLGNTTAYKHIRMDITLNNGDASYVALDELELNTEHPAGDFYDVAEGILYDSTDTPKSRVYLGEAKADGEGLVIPDTLVEYPVAHQDVTSMDVHGNAKFHSGFDLGQTWVDEKANRLYGVNYKNETDKPIDIIITSYATAINSGDQLYINDEPTARHYSPTNAQRGIYSAKIPIGSTYKLVTTNGSTAIEFWFEHK